MLKLDQKVHLGTYKYICTLELTYQNLTAGPTLGLFGTLTLEYITLTL